MDDKKDNPDYFRNKLSAYSHCMENAPSDLIAGAAKEQAASLEGERKFRGTGLHPDDSRIPHEIVNTQILATDRLRKLKAQNKSLAEYIEQNKGLIEQLDIAYKELQRELDIYHFGNNIDDEQKCSECGEVADYSTLLCDGCVRKGIER